MGCAVAVVGPVATTVVPVPSVRLPDVCPDGVFIVCPRYALTSQVFLIGRTFAAFNYNTEFIAGGSVDLRCQVRTQSSNSNGDEIGGWSSWSNIHSDFISTHTSNHRILQGVGQGTWWLVQVRLSEDVSPLDWEVHPNCGLSAYLIRTATLTEPGSQREQIL